MVTFSHSLQKLLSGKRPITLQMLINGFGEKSFAVLLLLLLAIPALPLPTGGITHIFEIIAMLLAIEIIAGRKTVWLPKHWLSKTLPESLQNSGLTRFIRIIRWVEKYSRPRLINLQNNSIYTGAVAIIILGSRLV